MDIREKLLPYRYHITVGVVGSVVLSLLLYAAPRIVTILAYFWPLFVSTAALVVVGIAFSGLSHYAAEIQGEKAGEGILDYVRGRPEHIE
ncbi:hypothetical protein CJ030_MR2G006271 [Morella rubra]|uniref:Uncharacterized protein n=1 Tax=Morella rubra TaxID=262757 RepID=A0A6A1WDA0_9ROSI|nr:hypothetical protein CJ030_MR2G006265 [Morella rubra]KAB1221698.1 hypothetical protein CJ030_MR2G006271 [Morella rubra]